MFKVVVYDIIGGVEKKLLGFFESIQITGTTVRDEYDIVHLEYDPTEEGWIDSSGKWWYDWIVESV